jgi:3-hydroxyisobutyrate dehydrogenase
MHIGYIGLGAMGGQLARRLLETYTVTVWDLNREAVAELEKLGASAAASADAMARQCDVVVVCLPRSGDVRQIIFGPQGLADGLSAGMLIIDQTSGIPAVTGSIAAELGARGVAMIDAPVSGNPAIVLAGRHTVMASGPDDCYEKALPILQTLSPNLFRCGARVGDGQAVKIINNALNASTRLALLEVVATARKMGLSLESITNAINNGSGRCHPSMMMLPALIEGRSWSNFDLALQLKDVTQAISLGFACGVPMPISTITRGLLQIGLNIFGNNARLADVVPLIEKLAGTRLVEDGAVIPSLLQAPARCEAGQNSGDTLTADVATLLDRVMENCNRAIAYECTSLAFKFGLELDATARAINQSSGWSAAFELIVRVLAHGGHTATVPLGRGADELKKASEMAFGCGAPMLIANAIGSIFETGLNDCGAEANVDELVHLFERAAGITFPGS